MMTNPDSIARREPERLKGLELFLGYDLVNFDQSLRPNKLILKMEVGEMHRHCPP
jgi:hypothetical protein